MYVCFALPPQRQGFQPCLLCITSVHCAVQVPWSLLCTLWVPEFSSTLPGSGPPAGQCWGTTVFIKTAIFCTLWFVCILLNSFLKARAPCIKYRSCRIIKWREAARQTVTVLAFQFTMGWRWHTHTHEHTLRHRRNPCCGQTGTWLNI